MFYQFSVCDGIPKNCVLTPGKEGVAQELDRLDGLAGERRASQTSFFHVPLPLLPPEGVAQISQMSQAWLGLPSTNNSLKINPSCVSRR